jgi:glycosyltransferase involved in cell wall biosynthesis
MTQSGAYSVLMPLAPWEPPEQVAMALASLKSQTLPPTQVVVSCDGAPHEGLNQVLCSTCLPVIIILGPGEEGVGPVLARGLEHCTEDLVVRADADDLSIPERCEIQVKAMTGNPKLAVMSSTILEFIDDPYQPFQIRDVPPGGHQLYNYSRWRNPINHPAAILRRKTILDHGNYRNCPGFEDYDLWLRLLKNGIDLDNLQTPLVLARVGANHIKRRHGLAYAIKEAKFLKTCGTENLMSWQLVAFLLASRTPMRLLPKGFQHYVTKKFLRAKIDQKTR